MEAQLLGIIDESDSVSDSTTETPEPSPTAEATPEQTSLSADIAVPDPIATAPGEVQSSGFKFLGRDWESLTKAEEVLGSQEGRISKANETIRGHEQRINEYWDYVQAVSKENEELRAAAEAKVQAQAEPEKAEGSRETWMKQVKLAMQIATQRGIDPNEVLMHAIEERLMQETEKRINERVEASTQPLREYEQQRQVDTAQQALFKWAQGQGVEGSARYPELQKSALYAQDGKLSDNENTKFVGTLYEIFNHFATQNPQFAYSGPGFDYAYRLAKEFHGMAPTPAATAAPQSRDENGRFLSNGAARAASELSGTNASLDRPARDEVQDRLKDLGKHSTIKIGSTDLGFYE
jgi:hypothetical protein